jgi:hypothetical protein
MHLYHVDDRGNNLYSPRYPPRYLARYSNRYSPNLYSSRFYSPSAEEIDIGYNHYYSTTNKENVFIQNKEEIHDALRKELRKGHSEFDSTQFKTNYIDTIIRRNWDILEECKKTEWIAAATTIRLVENLKCPITLFLMVDPVIVSNGKSYDRQSIVNCSLNRQNPLCPITRQRLDPNILIRNDTLRIFIREFVEIYQNKTGDEWSTIIELCAEYNRVKDIIEEEKKAAVLKKRQLEDAGPASSSSTYPTSSRSFSRSPSRDRPPRQRSVPMEYDRMDVDQPLLGNWNTQMNPNEVREYVGDHVRTTYDWLTTTEEQEDTIDGLVQMITDSLPEGARTRELIFPFLEMGAITNNAATLSRN